MGYDTTIIESCYGSTWHRRKNPDYIRFRIVVNSHLFALRFLPIETKPDYLSPKTRSAIVTILDIWENMFNGTLVIRQKDTCHGTGHVSYGIKIHVPPKERKYEHKSTSHVSLRGHT